jgi:coenzyme F420 hydrogenase subunit beta
MFVKNKKELEKIMQSHLCNRCGTCVGLSDGAIEFKDREGKYQPHFVGEISDINLSRILKSCSGKYFDFPKYTKEFYPYSKHFHIYSGAYESISIGYATDQKIRSEGASGGIISALLIYLLEKKKIDGAVVLRMSPEKPWLSEPYIATTKEEVLDAAQSKYTISSVNEILSQTEAFDGKLAYVGIPPQVQAIRKLQSIGDPSVKNIDYIFGPFYGNTLHFSSVVSFLKSYKIKDYRTITKLYFRYGEWPGNMRVETNDGKIAELKKFHANYLIPFHILRNSLYCTDLSNEFTDISGGDAWAPIYEERGKGYSMIIGRSKKGQELLDEMKKENWLSFNEIDESEAISMHSHGYDLKKRGAFIRIRFRKLLGKSIPDYGYQLKGFGFKRHIMEVIISSMFLILNTPFARWTVEQFSPKFIGSLFEKSRTIWKKSTHNIKREKL